MAHIIDMSTSEGMAEHIKTLPTEWPLRTLGATVSIAAPLQQGEQGND